MVILNTFHTTVEKALGEIDPRWREYDGLIICGTHTPTNIDQMLIFIREAREAGYPFLGICAGYQLAYIEYARNVLGIKDATSEEWDTEGTFVVKKRKELKVGLHEGETWWSNFEVDDKFLGPMPQNFFVVPFHPEYQSSKENPHPLLVDFIAYSKNHHE